MEKILLEFLQFGKSYWKPAIKRIETRLSDAQERYTNGESPRMDFVRLPSVRRVINRARAGVYSKRGVSAFAYLSSEKGPLSRSTFDADPSR